MYVIFFGVIKQKFREIRIKNFLHQTLENATPEMQVCRDYYFDE